MCRWRWGWSGGIRGVVGDLELAGDVEAGQADEGDDRPGGQCEPALRDDDQTELAALDLEADGLGSLTPTNALTLALTVMVPFWLLVKAKLPEMSTTLAMEMVTLPAKAMGRGPVKWMVTGMFWPGLAGSGTWTVSSTVPVWMVLVCKKRAGPGEGQGRDADECGASAGGEGIAGVGGVEDVVVLDRNDDDAEVGVGDLDADAVEPEERVDAGGGDHHFGRQRAGQRSGLRAADREAALDGETGWLLASVMARVAEPRTSNSLAAKVRVIGTVWKGVAPEPGRFR